jgi:hypothetical protein
MEDFRRRIGGRRLTNCILDQREMTSTWRRTYFLKRTANFMLNVLSSRQCDFDSVNSSRRKRNQRVPFFK